MSSGMQGRLGRIRRRGCEMALMMVLVLSGAAPGNSLRKLLQVEDEARIVGGENAPKGRFPYMSSLKNDLNQHQCGAVLIGSRWALTAAHCLHPNSRFSVNLNAFLTIGAHASADNESVKGVEEIKVKKTHIHPNFTSDSLRAGGDIALLELAEDSTLTPAPLSHPYFVPEGELLALGWGLYDTILQMAYLEVTPDAVCKDTWKGMGPSIICASGDVADTCRGDSGGPLILPHAPDRKISDGKPQFDSLVALTSFGDADCSRLEKPGAYTLIAPYLVWIESVMNGEEEQPQVCSEEEITIRSNEGNSPLYKELLKLDLYGCDDLDISQFESCSQEFDESSECCAGECMQLFRSISSQCWRSLATGVCASGVAQLPSEMDRISRRCGGRPFVCGPAARSSGRQTIEENDVCEPMDPVKPLPTNLIPVTLNLIKMASPQNCQDLDFEDFQICASDLGATEGCCKEACKEFLEKINDKCWDDIEGMVCQEKTPHTAVMLDLLSRRCSKSQKEMWCLQDCEDRVVVPKKEITISPFQFSVALGRISLPDTCEDFSFEHLTKCFDEFGRENGCCSEDCQSVLDGVSNVCWGGIEKLLCSKGTEDSIAMMDLLSRRCDSQRREIVCEETVRVVAAAKSPLEPQVRQCEVEGTCDEINDGLLVAAETGNLASVKALVAQGADVNITDFSNYDRTPLHWASNEGHALVVQYLLKKGADIEAQSTTGTTALMYSIPPGHLRVAKILLANGANVDATERNGWTALIYSARYGHEQLVALLLTYGPELEVRDTLWQQTPLVWAAQHDHLSVVELLIEAGASLEGRTRRGWTALMLVASQGNHELVRLFVDKGADTQARTEKKTVLTTLGAIPPNSTALHLAARAGHVVSVEILAENEENKRLRDGDGNTPADVIPIWSSNRQQLLDLLQV